jgi:hypothetical protein
MTRPLPHGPMPPRCALGRTVPTTIEADAIKRTGWRDHGLLVIAVDDPRLGWDERALVRALGDKLYGRKDTAP